jgi:uncharacterized protein YbjT (DUF2867 family)
MRVLVTGATGLIGSAAAARLTALGHDVIAAVRKRDRAARRVAAAQTDIIDFADMTAPEAWRPHLAGIDAVLNCAGLLQGQGRTLRTLHADAAAALFAACERQGVRRVVHFSAIGVDRGALSDFSRTKLAGDQALMARDLDWVILRPSVAVGRAAYGASALFRALAILPVVPMFNGAGRLQIVQLEEVVDTIVLMLAADAPARVALELVGPEQLPFADVVLAYRRWFGLPDQRPVAFPAWLFDVGCRLGDFAGFLGWRPPIRTNARLEMARGAVGDGSEWIRLTGIKPRRLAEALAAEPASVQEHWFASLYLLKPALFTILAGFWILTGVISLGPGYATGAALLAETNLEAMAQPLIVAGAFADIVIGAAIAVRRSARFGLYAALAVSAFYIVAATLVLPRLWLDPLGPLLKTAPIVGLTLAALAILDDR